MRYRSSILLITVLMAFCSSKIDAQQTAMAPYKFDFGGGIGMSGYIGDVNSSNPFKHPGFTADLSARYIIDTRWALRASLSALSLSGNSADIANVLPNNAQFDFSSQVFDLTIRGEFNFLPYGIGETYKRLRRISPYLALGVGLSLSSADGHTATAPAIPMAFGVKYKLKDRINLQAEFSMTKVFSDHVDGANIADLNLIKTDFYKNTDWFSRITIGISYEFGKRCEACHYVD